jgi:hypothetical protein
MASLDHHPQARARAVESEPARAVAWAKEKVPERAPVKAAEPAAAYFESAAA